ncbi:MAG TPA: PBP1A family penicillin-binding protein [Polyangia bacterium]|jgi:penicillin-binding protein 1A|nr:PBP1A family penicillin-binding protein [Polyangia bacterium]
MAAGPSLDDRDPRRAKGKANKKPKPLKAAAKKGSGGGRASSGGAMRFVKLGLWLGVLAAFLGVAGLVGLFAYYGSDPKLPKISKLDDFHPKQVTRILDRAGTPIGELGIEKRTVIPFAAIPKLLVNAVVAAEDADYFNHEGIDYRGMLRAFIENVLRGRTAQGGSTITQQVVKTMLLTPERTMRRKVQEIILARQLSQKLSKEEVLALYLNQIYYGHGRYGCEEAARYYFGKSVRDVNLAEAALLAGLPQSPERLSPRKHPDAAKTRQRYVLGQMAEHGFIDRKLADKVAAEPIRLAKEPLGARGMATEIVDSVGRALADRGDASESGLTVQTTIDARMQELARASLERGLEDFDARQGFRGPSGHLTGKALDKRRAALAAAHKGGVRDGELIEGLVTRVETTPVAAAPGKDAGKPLDAGGKLFVDLGAGEGVVDLSLEPRYAKGAKPIATRFSAGDVVRVRVAMDRPHSEGGPTPLQLELGPQAAMVVMDPRTRELLAIVGGYGFKSGGFNRAERAERQPGSSFKAIVYAAALEAGKLTPATIIDDAPMPIGDWKFDNFEKESFAGPIRARLALAESKNTVAVKVLNLVGIPAAQAAATRFGITTPLPQDAGLALALGVSSVKPIDMANVYATFASGGLEGAPVFLKKVGGEASPPAQLSQVLKPEVAYVMTSMLRSVVDEGTARAAASRLRRPAAGKTGTTNRKVVVGGKTVASETIDAWFIGYTPDLLAAVWVGFDEPHGLGRGATGATAALPIWTEFMTKALAGRPTKDFAPPPGVVIQRIDKATGLLARPGVEENTMDEVFIAGTAPTEVAPAAGEESSADKLLMDQ